MGLGVPVAVGPAALMLQDHLDDLPDASPPAFVHRDIRDAVPQVLDTVDGRPLTYSLFGKLEALERALVDGIEFLGDLHFEPSHGTNLMSILTLTETVKLLNAKNRKILMDVRVLIDQQTSHSAPTIAVSDNAGITCLS